MEKIKKTGASCWFKKSFKRESVKAKRKMALALYICLVTLLSIKEYQINISMSTRQ